MTPLTQLVARIVVLPIVIIAVALLLKGYHGAGDGFSAGVLASAAVLVPYLVFDRRHVEARMPAAHLGIGAGIVGIAIMAGVAFLGPVLGRPMLSHWPPPGAEISRVLGIDVHTALLFDAGIALLIFGTLISIIELVGDAPRRPR
jgi:multisubunit Na+/H+ antiporter MnhB subunit